jgi:hypothetical protein
VLAFCTRVDAAVGKHNLAAHGGRVQRARETELARIVAAATVNEREHDGAGGLGGTGIEGHAGQTHPGWERDVRREVAVQLAPTPTVATHGAEFATVAPDGLELPAEQATNTPVPIAPKEPTATVSQK